MTLEYLLLALLLLSLMTVFVLSKKLTPGGSAAAGLIGTVVYLADGWKGIALLFVFFILSVLATSHRKALKVKIDSSHAQTGGRTAGQVFANGGIAALSALLMILDPINKELYILTMACSLSSALSDTLSSELGMVYGTKFYNVTSFNKDSNGLDGVVSLEGTLIGLAGACLVGILSSGLSRNAVIITAAGFFGNLADSYLGATLERRFYLANNAVNFFSTALAAIFGWLMYAFTGSI